MDKGFFTIISLVEVEELYVVFQGHRLLHHLIVSYIYYLFLGAGGGAI